MSWFISNLQEGIVKRTTLREVLQLRAPLNSPNRLTRVTDDQERANLWISKNCWS